MPTKQTEVPLDFNSGQTTDRSTERRSANRGFGSPHGSSRSWHRVLTRTLLGQLGDPAVAIRLWDGHRIDPPQHVTARRPVAGTITVTNPTALTELAKRRDVGFGDEFSSGGLLIDGSLVDVLIELELSRQQARPGPVAKLLDVAPKVLTRKPRRNSLTGSKDNIGHHYNIGNDFYEAWLDKEAMQYTCAYYPYPGMTLEQAQLAKLDHVCRKLELRPGDIVYEAGCGWGGLARHMAANYGVRVKAYNISTEQLRFARERARTMGLDDRIEYVEDDYRNMKGSCDKFVSIGMLEHVGKENFTELGQVVDRCLRDDGRGLIHSIGRNAPRLMNPWVEKRIFPGAYPPSLGEMMAIFEGPNFSVIDVENLRLHYAKTLEHWLQRFDDRDELIREQFDSQFVRAWRLYLAGSIAAFKTSSLQLFQVSFARGLDNSVPANREHLYPTVSRSTH